MSSLTYELTLAGLAVGSAAALSGIGLIVTHRATGVLNLGHGAVAMVCAYVLRELAVERGWPVPAATAVTLLLVAPALGLLLDRAVFRPLSLRGADPARTLVASIGVFVLLIGGAALVWGEGARADAPEPFGDSPWPPLAAVLLLAALVGVVTRRTRLGRELRAVVDNRHLAVLGGIDADRVAAVGWAFGSFTAGLTGVLLAPYVRLDPYGLPLLVVEVIAVAALARMRSLPVAVGAALLLGVAQSQLTRLHPEGWAGPLVQSLGANLFVVALLAAALLFPPPTPTTPTSPAPHTHRPTTPNPPGPAPRPAARSRPRRGALPGPPVSPTPPAPPGPRLRRGGVRDHRGRPAVRPRPRPRVLPQPLRAVPRFRVPAPRFLPLLAAALFVMPLGLAGDDLRTALQVPALAVILLSLVVVSGRSGQISLGQAAYAGLGALFAALLADGRLPGLPPLPQLLALAVAVALTAPLGLLTGRPAIRRHGLALALTTLAFGVAVSRFVLDQPYATAGLSVSRPAGFASDRAYYVLELGLLLVCLLLVAQLRRGRSGRALAALRDHEEGAAAAGVRVPALKVLTFVAGAALAALGGGLLSMSVRAFDPTAYDPVRGLLWFAAVVVLGADSLLTACAAAALLVALDAGTTAGLAAVLVGTLALLSPLLRRLREALGGANPLDLRAPRAAPVRRTDDSGTRPAHKPPDDGSTGPTHDASSDSNTQPTHNASTRGTSSAARSAGAVRRGGLLRPSGLPFLPVRRGPAGPVSAPVAASAPASAPGAPGIPSEPLRARGVRLAYGDFTALAGVDLTVPYGQVTALVGANGAGKSTLFHCLCGTLRPGAGSIELGGTDITRRSAHARTRLGVARTFQQLAVFPSLTVAENVLLGAEQGHRRTRDPAAVEPVLRLLGLDGPVRHRRAAGLPTGTLRRVELARALAGGPHTLLLDEPAAGLDAAETAALARVLAALAADGTAVLVVEHDPDLVADIATTVHTMAAGRITATAAAEDGTTSSATAPVSPAPVAEEPGR
ncbi:ATP-binding cassette domain-containing protein [Streptomyces sp. NPDC004111]|uniref:ABC transporter permease subunit n=1 Tax=Streptomyces sp. NPDC004111 TaxID=3364690 RepID=UPI0036CAD9F2